MFNAMDINKTGFLTFEQLKVGLQKIDPQLAEEEIQQLMDAADADGNGKLDYGEFMAVTIHLQRMDNDEHLRKAFAHFDLDGDNFIDFDELKQTLGDELGSDDTDMINAIMQEVDLDKDGKISYDEFVSMMRTGTDWRKASRHYSRERFTSLSIKLMKDGSVQKQGNDKR
ncbi:hypothetical protein L7F22_063638 [Adiantum nelumboides]|nr:hypothetical protein [Adiantum nelumboides]